MSEWGKGAFTELDKPPSILSSFHSEEATHIHSKSVGNFAVLLNTGHKGTQFNPTKYLELYATLEFPYFLLLKKTYGVSKALDVLTGLCKSYPPPLLWAYTYISSVSSCSESSEGLCRVQEASLEI